MLSAMHKLESVRVPQGPAHDKFKALGTAVRTARTCLRAVGAEEQLFDSFFTIGNWVKKVANITQTRWFYYKTEHPDQKEHKAFEVWPELEGMAAFKHRQCVPATGYQPA